MAKLALTWQQHANGKGGRWRKKHKGKIHYLGNGKGKDDLASYRLALAKWQELKAQLEVPPKYLEGIECREKVLKWYAADASTDDFKEQVEQELATLKSNLSKPNVPIFPFDLDPTTISASQAIIWIERMEQLDFLEHATKKEVKAKAGVRFMMDDFLKDAENSLLIKSIGQGRFSNIKLYVNKFANWVEFNQNEINENSIRGFYLNLCKQISSNLLNVRSARDCFSVMRTFINFCYENKMIENFPRNTNSKRFIFKIKNSKPEIFEIHEIHEFLNVNDEKLVLFSLLMLNCGMTQIDISDLLADEIDFDKWRLTRKRSKAEDYKNAPIVNYKLWDETMALLKKHANKQGRCFSTRNGTQLVNTYLTKNGKTAKQDMIWTAYRNGFDRPIKIKRFRKTGATLISNKFPLDVEQRYLGQTTKSIAETFYGAKETLDDALDYLHDEIFK